MQLFKRAELLTMVALLPYYILGYSFRKKLASTLSKPLRSRVTVRPRSNRLLGLTVVSFSALSKSCIYGVITWILIMRYWENRIQCCLLVMKFCLAKFMRWAYAECHQLPFHVKFSSIIAISKTDRVHPALPKELCDWRSNCVQNITKTALPFPPPNLLMRN